MLQDPSIIGDVAQVVVPSDFMQPQAAAAFGALVHAHREGGKLDPFALHEILLGVGVVPDHVWIMEAQRKAYGAWRHHTKTVIGHRLRRDILAAIDRAGQDARERGIDPLTVLDDLRTRLDAIHVPDGRPPEDLYSLDEFIDRPESESAPWIVPGLLRRGWRVVVVAGEGAGKSTLWRQFAVLAGQGMHPLGFGPMPKRRTLLVDLENPPDAIADGCRPIREQVTRRNGYEPDRAWLWHRPAGIDLRTRAHRSQLAAVLAATQPDLVCLGPLYKAYRRDPRETDEQAVAEVQAALDELRTRFGFALLLEHHAPQDNAGIRKMRPYGSSLWLRWPEIGLSFEADNEGPPGAMKLGRWREDRMKSMWPDRLDRGQVWPWEGYWRNPERSMP
jgi:hypothetical protein